MLENFYTVQERVSSDGSIKALLLFNSLHPVFGGHFPEQPVVPGVCMMQIAKEIVESELNMETNLVQADNLKFIHTINPQVNPSANIAIDYSVAETNIKISVSMFDGDLIFFKMKATLNVR